MDKHWQVIEFALESMLVDLTQPGDSYTTEQREAKRAEFDAALAFVREMRVPTERTPQGLDMPDGPGWWAWEGYFACQDDPGDPSDIQRRVCEVLPMPTTGRLAVREGRYVEEMIGKWWKVQLPWQAQPWDAAKDGGDGNGE